MASAEFVPPPQPPCDDCTDSDGCMLKGTLCRELIYRWLQGNETTSCTFYEPFEPTYHGIKGVRA